MPAKNHPRPVMRFESITPEKAQKYLEKMAPNRQVTRAHVEYLARQMRDGLWIEGTGDPIRFNGNGDLCDGQHRLRAILDTGLTIECAVIRNVSDKAMPVIDTGRSRLLHDFLAMRGVSKPRPLAAALQQLGAYYRSQEFGTSQWTRLKQPIQASLDLLASHPGLRDSISATLVVSGLLGGGHGIWAAIHYVLTAANYDDAEVFFRKLATGEDLRAGDPVGLLRNRLIS